MKKQINNVKEFNIAFRAGYQDKPDLVRQELAELRYNLGIEELNEYALACKNSDLVGVADALGDQLYILLGTILCHGMQDVIEEVFDRIHQNNMTKLGSDGKPIINGENGIFDKTRSLGKVLKPKDWKPVSLEDIFERKVLEG